MVFLYLLIRSPCREQFVIPEELEVVRLGRQRKANHRNGVFFLSRQTAISGIVLDAVLRADVLQKHDRRMVAFLSALSALRREQHHLEVVVEFEDETSYLHVILNEKIK